MYSVIISKRTFSLFFLLGLLMGAVGSTSAAVLDLNYVDGATAIDEGPQDGIYDYFAPSNLGSVNNNGFTSFRTAFEFNISSIPAGAVINSAGLSMTIRVYDSGVRQVELHSYIGNGSVQLEDFSLDNLVDARSLNPSGTQTVFYDVTDEVANHIASAQYILGFNIREEPNNAANLLVMNIHMAAEPGSPTLSVDYSEAPASEAPAAIPVMSWAGLVISIFLLLYLALRRLDQLS